MKRKNIVKLATWGIVAAIVAWGLSVIAVYWVSAGRVFDKTSDVPHCRAAVVLGCRKTLPNGLYNLYFTRRIAAAAELYKAGKVDCLIVSGDNHIKEYDEASDMKESLAKEGIPAELVVCDYAGFRTLDSVVRAKKVFGLDSFIVVSQKDHVRRAVFTARGFGCNAYGYAAPDVSRRYSIKTPIREQLAKVAAVLDVILRRGPKFLGPLEPLPDGSSADVVEESATRMDTTARPEKWAVPMACVGVPNLHKVSDKLYRSAQPTAEGMTNLVALGIKTVVNLRHSHSDSDEIGGLPLKAHRIEIFTGNMKDKYVTDFLAVLDDTNAVPVLVHCQHGADRTGTLCAMYRILREGWTADAAIDEMTNGGYGYHSVWRNLPRFIRKASEQMKQK